MQEDRVPSSPDDLLGIGERLRNAREAKRLTLAVAETLTRIRATYLSALEAEQVARLPRAVRAARAAIPGGGVELTVQATGPCWLLVSADGEEVFKGTVNAGDVRVWRARARVTVRVGNSEAVSVLVNGQPVQQDPRRQVWEETFTAP